MKKEFLRVTLVPLCIVIMASCSSPKKDQVASPSADTVAQGATISESAFGSLPDGTPFLYFILRIQTV